MIFTLKIDCSNDAFEESLTLELARILHEIADKVACSDTTEPYDRDIAAMDANGNKVGVAKLR